MRCTPVVLSSSPPIAGCCRTRLTPTARQRSTTPPAVRPLPRRRATQRLHQPLLQRTAVQFRLQLRRRQAGPIPIPASSSSSRMAGATEQLQTGLAVTRGRVPLVPAKVRHIMAMQIPTSSMTTQEARRIMAFSSLTLARHGTRHQPHLGRRHSSPGSRQAAATAQLPCSSRVLTTGLPTFQDLPGNSRMATKHPASSPISEVTHRLFPPIPASHTRRSRTGKQAAGTLPRQLALHPHSPAPSPTPSLRPAAIQTPTSAQRLTQPPRRAPPQRLRQSRCKTCLGRKALTSPSPLLGSCPQWTPHPAAPCHR